MVHSNDDALNKIPLKSVIDDEEKNGGEFIPDTATADEARREERRVQILQWMKKLTIGVICFIGIALICYLIISLCFSDKNNNNNSGDEPANSASNSTLLAKLYNYNKEDNNNNKSSNNNNSSNSNSNNSPTLTVASDFDEVLTEIDTTLPTVESLPPDNDELMPMPTATVHNTMMQETSEPNDLLSSTMPSLLSSLSSSSSLPTMATLKDIPIMEENYTSKLGVYQHAAVCSDKHVCSKIGSKILQDGGSAVDSAIAALLCNGITTLHSMGIGGGMLMNIYIKDREQAFSIDGREVAPFGANQNMFNDIKNVSEHAAMTIAVPGELKGYHRAHEKFGKLLWKQLVEPSIELCREGFYMGKHIWHSAKYKKEFIKKNQMLRKMLYDESNDDIYPLGSKIKPSNELCRTYELLAENGPLDFYNGTLSQLVAEDLAELGSLVTSDDLETYRADMVNSITMQLGDNVLYAVPPISSGPVVANILSTLEGFNFTKRDLWDEEHKAETIHIMAEAMKLSFAKRWELGDVRFNDVRELVSRLTNPETGALNRALINKLHTLKSIHEYGALFSGEDDAGTSHLSVLAANGDAVSVTSSINEYFGSTFVGRRTGVIFNNGMIDFSIPGRKDLFNLPPSPTNFIEPQKRPMSSMSPLILTNSKGDVNLVIGAAGGSKIISAIVEVLARVLWFGQNIKEAIDAPRFHHQLIPNVLEYEENHFTETLLKLLEAKGHKVAPYANIGSVVCGIVRNETAIYANADYRKQGGTAGF